MRTIKFRAWVEPLKRVMGVTSFSINGHLEPFLIEDSEYGYWFSEDFTLMQYTGLKDSKGTEIYEGDLVSYQKRNLDRAFGEGGGEDYLSYISELKYRDQGFNVPQGFVINLKVIGNKFDDPDLWEENK